MDDRCTIHDFNNGDIIVESSSFCHGLYTLDVYEKCANEAACRVLDT